MSVDPTATPDTTNTTPNKAGVAALTANLDNMNLENLNLGSFDLQAFIEPFLQMLNQMLGGSLGGLVDQFAQAAGGLNDGAASTQDHDLAQKAEAEITAALQPPQQENEAGNGIKTAPEDTSARHEENDFIMTNANVALLYEEIADNGLQEVEIEGVTYQVINHVENAESGFEGYALMGEGPDGTTSLVFVYPGAKEPENLPQLVASGDLSPEAVIRKGKGAGFEADMDTLVTLKEGKVDTGWGFETTLTSSKSAQEVHSALFTKESLEIAQKLDGEASFSIFSIGHSLGSVHAINTARLNPDDGVSSVVIAPVGISGHLLQGQNADQVTAEINGKVHAIGDPSDPAFGILSADGNSRLTLDTEVDIAGLNATDKDGNMIHIQGHGGPAAYKTALNNLEEGESVSVAAKTNAPAPGV